MLNRFWRICKWQGYDSTVVIRDQQLARDRLEGANGGDLRAVLGVVAGGTGRGDMDEDLHGGARPDLVDQFQAESSLVRRGSIFLNL